MITKRRFMPKLYEYMGLYIMFYANDHEPIHVHCKYQDTESKADIIRKWIDFFVYNVEIQSEKITRKI